MRSRQFLVRLHAAFNFYRFETDDVTAKLLADGVRGDDLVPLIHLREFAVEQGFQEGDDSAEHVFSVDLILTRELIESLRRS
ncbi:MAG: hypothetical protein ACHP65_08970 [Legionellales bacterium]